MGRALGDLASRPEWLAELEDLSIDCSAAFAAETADRLLSAYGIFAKVQLPSGMVLWEYEKFRALVGAGAFESAALTFLNSACGYMISQGPGGACIATVILPGSHHEATAHGDTMALALVGACAGAFVGAQVNCKANPIMAGPFESTVRH